jgi:hypothetical protein
VVIDQDAAMFVDVAVVDGGMFLCLFVDFLGSIVLLLALVNWSTALEGGFDSDCDMTFD